MRRAMTSVLVTGGAGFIGNALVRRLLETMPEVRVVTLDALTYAGSLDNLADLPDPQRHTFVHGDVCDARLVEEVVRAHEIDTVLHAAAESHVDRSIDAPMAFLRTNVEGTAAALRGARDAWARRTWIDDPPRFHHVSTDEVYGDLGLDQPPAREGDPYRPSSPYAASKASADLLLLAWRRTYGVAVSLTHGSNTYGPRQYPEKFIPVVIGKALAGEPIPVYGDGLQVREWIHVDDHADGILAAVTRGAEGRAYNLGGGTSLANLELVQGLCAELDRLRPDAAPHARLIASVPDRPGHDRRYAVDAMRARLELGWTARRSWSEGLRQTVQWYVDHPQS
ncbi:MAG: dTDP-glucose 4,6-dehydratase [Alphaproteobacteria bacterium]|nr:dTDP-glucose 4,6-dehydratase [Alphaproteobacteria bacterium]